MPMKLSALGGGTVDVADESLQQLKSGLRGTTITAADGGYDEARSIWNAMIDRRPGLIARCAGVADVVHAVRFARRHGVLASLRGGGHNIAGLAVCEGGMVIDLSSLKGVWVDPRTRRVRAQAGCTLAEVDRETQLHGLATVLGFVSTTGIAGLTVGGGFGYLTRRYGWTSDNVVSMDVITADGVPVRATDTENADLFWALRGGGGNFGVVTSFEYAAFPVGPEIFGGAIAWRGEDAAAVLEAFAGFSASAPRELTSVAVLRKAPPAPWLPKEVHGQPIVAIFVCHSGSLEAGEAAVRPLRALRRPVADILARRPYVQMQGLLDATQPKGRRYYWKSHYLSRIDGGLINQLAQHAAEIQSPHSAILVFQVGGALAERLADHSPVGNRDATYVLNIAAAWERVDDDQRNVAWARNCFVATRSYSTGGAYVNFLTEEEGSDRIAASYGLTNLARLATLKRQLDPDNFFRHAKSVLP